MVDAKRANSFNNAIKMLNANVEITHNRFITLENRTSMMAKAIMPALKDLKFQINKTNKRLASQCHDLEEILWVPNFLLLYLSNMLSTIGVKELRLST